MTAHGTPDLINEAAQAGFNCILSKPFTPSELRGAVDTRTASARIQPSSSRHSRAP